MVSQDSSCGPVGAEAPENVENMARRVAAVCKKGVWKAWRGDAAGLDPIYSISLWHQTQTLLVKCGLVEVLALLLGESQQSSWRKRKVHLIALSSGFAWMEQLSTNLNSRDSTRFWRKARWASSSTWH